MTVITTLITKHCVVNASDSFITVRLPNGDLKVERDKQSKLIRVEAFSGVIAYWGLAWDGARKWNTFEWLKKQAGAAGGHHSPEAFATYLAAQLTTEMSSLTFAQPIQSGLGIHFSAYERVNGYDIPEMFQIRNWSDDAYSGVRPSGFEVRRETYGAYFREAHDRPESDRDPGIRMMVHEFLHDVNGLFSFVNGDARLFSPIGTGTFDVFGEMQRRRIVQDPSSVDMHLSMARRPIEMVGKLLRDFAAEGNRHIGGKLHDLAVKPGAVYESTTGD